MDRNHVVPQGTNTCKDLKIMKTLWQSAKQTSINNIGTVKMVLFKIKSRKCFGTEDLKEGTTAFSRKVSRFYWRINYF
jgi:hypothetical protein